MPALPPALFAPIAPLRHGLLDVDEVHTIYREETGATEAFRRQGGFG